MSDKTDFIPTLTHATERDIDLILVEELYSNYDFVVWMAAQVGITGPFKSWDVKHSKRRTRSRREIDIFIELVDVNGRKCAILIENKIDATEQPDQAESYREELDVLDGIFQERAIIIICPDGYARKYMDFSSKFDATVTYESVRDYFLEMAKTVGDELVLRARLRRELFDQAIHKHRRGYNAIPDKTVGDFNAKYVALLSSLDVGLVPGKSMMKPANPRESTSMIFDQDATLTGLPKIVRPRRFAHELGRGSHKRANYVAVTFQGWGVALPAVADRLEQDAQMLGASFSAKPATKTRPNPGLVMSISCEPVDNQGSFDAQRQELIDGISLAEDLRCWLLMNVETLKAWKALIDNAKRV